MGEREMRRRFLKARQLAANLADRCDLCTAGNIRDSKACCSEDAAYVCIEYKDNVERSQIIAAFVYGSSLQGMSFQCSRLEDIITEHGKKLVSITLLVEGDSAPKNVETTKKGEK